jgi:hypothetical protein
MTPTCVYFVDIDLSEVALCGRPQGVEGREPHRDVLGGTHTTPRIARAARGALVCAVSVDNGDAACLRVKSPQWALMPRT